MSAPSAGAGSGAVELSWMDNEMHADDVVLDRLGRDVGRALTAAGLQLALAESCTGGWIAKVITDVAGSSGWFGCGIVSYSNQAKIDLLDVPPAMLAERGAVSEPVVIAMAEGVRLRAKADVAIAVSGIAGPGGGSAQKPVGTVCFSWSRKGMNSVVETHVFSGDREAVRRQTVTHALQRLLRLLESMGNNVHA